MNFFGNLIGHAVEVDGKKRVAQEPSIKDLIWRNMYRNLESMNGQIGVFKLTSRNVCPLFGRRNLLTNMLMMMKRSLRNLEKLL